MDLTPNNFFQAINFIKNYKISISTSKRFHGIKDTLLGWVLIGFSSIFFKIPSEPLVAETSFVILFFSGCLTIFILVFIEGISNGSLREKLENLLIKKNNKTDEVHLTQPQRIKWIYFRGLIATTGYIALNISRIYFGVVDNSAIFGADALVFALLAWFFLSQKFNFKEWLGIIIASFGVVFILFFDLESFNWKTGISSGFAGLFSSLAMAIIFFITGIIVRHDPPKRVAFHQCIAGFLIALVILSFTLLLKKTSTINFNFPEISSEIIKNSIMTGILYAAALIFFLRAFLYTEPIIIAVLGCSFGIFIIGFEWLFEGTIINNKDFISFCLISFGCFLLIHEEYRKDKKKQKNTEAKKPIYYQNLKTEMHILKEKFNSGILDRYSYISEQHEFNKLLLEYSSLIKNSLIESIEILPNSLIFTFNPLGIKVKCDGGARSAPFEILNFGNYEIDDELLSYSLIENGDTILDIGAHIGWYSLNWAKRFPNSSIFSFEPIKITCDFLLENLKINNVVNVKAYNYGFSDKNEEKELYYFKGGSAIASVENLIQHKNCKKIKCHLRTLDSALTELKIKSVDFIKCDVEGFELFVIKGAQQTIKKFKPILLVEIYEEWCKKCGYSSETLLKKLKTWGYEIFQASDNKLIKITSLSLKDDERFNYFFLHLEKHKDLIDKYCFHKK